jgi:hypothetical protein
MTHRQLLSVDEFVEDLESNDSSDADAEPTNIGVKRIAVVTSAFMAFVGAMLLAAHAIGQTSPGIALSNTHAMDRSFEVIVEGVNATDAAAQGASANNTDATGGPAEGTDAKDVAAMEQYAGDNTVDAQYERARIAFEDHMEAKRKGLPFTHIGRMKKGKLIDRSEGGDYTNTTDVAAEGTVSKGVAAMEHYEAADSYFFATAKAVSQDWEPMSEHVRAEDIPPGHLMKVYHQTSPEACQAIMNSNFRLGKPGWCGRGIYFALTPNATRRKAVAGSSGHGCMMELTIDVGRIRRYENCGRWGAMNLKKLNRENADSILFEPPEKSGDEVIIFEAWRVREKRIIPFDPSWMSNRWHGKLAR